MFLDTAPILVNLVHQNLRMRRGDGHEFVDQLRVLVYQEPSDEAPEAVANKDQLLRVKNLDETAKIV